MKLKIISAPLFLFINLLFHLYSSGTFAQGLNHTFLLGYSTALFDTNVTSPKARLNIDSNNIQVIPETRKMAFRSTQGNISDQHGNFLMSSNGCWIANATGDTMLNGSGLNPGLFAKDWCDSTRGLPVLGGNLILPFPGDTTKYILFHQTANYDANLASTELYYSTIDLTLDSGLGGVTLKNQMAVQDTLSWGISACKHANGRDWWVTVLKENSMLIYKLLLTPNGISSQTVQNLNCPGPVPVFNGGQPLFSPDGTKFAYTFGYGGMTPYHDVRLFDFDRCTGLFSNLGFIPFSDGAPGFGLTFSSNSRYLYHSSFNRIYQIDTDSSTLPVDTVAGNDGFYSPYPPFQTNYWLMYRAANGKIYISSGNGVIDLHFINYPDSAGISCDVHQHDLHLPCFSVRGNVNHPNYYLGPVIGSVCDSLIHVGVDETGNHDFHFSIFPNPVTDGYTKIIYLLPRNKSGVFEVYDVSGRVVYKMNLPPWSTLQQISLPNLAPGIYNAVITSGMNRVNKKIAVFNK